jgi:hypothetical protein
MGKARQYYSRLIDNKNLIPNGKLYGILLLISLVETTSLKFMPWIANEFSLHSGGYPDVFMFRLCGYSKVFQSVFSLGIQTTVFIKLKNSSEYVGKCSFILIVTFISTVLVVAVSMFEITFQIAGLGNLNPILIEDDTSVHRLTVSLVDCKDVQVINPIVTSNEVAVTAKEIR